MSKAKFTLRTVPGPTGDRTHHHKDDVARAFNASAIWTLLTMQMLIPINKFMMKYLIGNDVRPA